MGRVYLGDDTACCACDRNTDNDTTVDDLLIYLTDWFNGASHAEFDGAPGIGVGDLLAFLACWFDGC